MVACCFPCALAFSDPLPPARPQEALRTLSMQVDSDQVQLVQIIYFPVRITSQVRLTPQRLKEQYLYQITIRNLQYTVAGTELLSALKRTTAIPSSNQGDLRWGVLFTLAGGSVREIYLDGVGRFGQVDNAQAAFQGGLYEWLRQLTAPLK
jgi:hypothetical protein